MHTSQVIARGWFVALMLGVFTSNVLADHQPKKFPWLAPLHVFNRKVRCFFSLTLSVGDMYGKLRGSKSNSRTTRWPNCCFSMIFR